MQAQNGTPQNRTPWNPDFGLRFVSVYLTGRDMERVPTWDYETEGAASPGWYRVGMEGPNAVSWDGPYSTRRIAEGR